MLICLKDFLEKVKKSIFQNKQGGNTPLGEQEIQLVNHRLMKCRFKSPSTCLFSRTRSNTKRLYRYLLLKIIVHRDGWITELGWDVTFILVTVEKLRLNLLDYGHLPSGFPWNHLYSDSIFLSHRKNWKWQHLKQWQKLINHQQWHNTPCSTTASKFLAYKKLVPICYSSWQRILCSFSPNVLQSLCSVIYLVFFCDSHVTRSAAAVDLLSNILNSLHSQRNVNSFLGCCSSSSML